MKALYKVGLEDNGEDALGLGRNELTERRTLPELVAVVLDLDKDRLIKAIEELEAPGGD